MSVLSVGLPAYRAKDIGWLGLESLCRQKSPCDWELLIVEEDYLRMDLDPYIDRLYNVGCVRIFHEVLEEWIPLSQKYYIMIQKVSKHSKAFLLQATDDYSHPYRLQIAFDMLDKYDLVQQPKGLFYDIPTGKTVLLDWETMPVHPTCLSMSYKMERFRILPNVALRRSVDKWIYQEIRQRGEVNIWLDKQYWEKGVNTQGQNNISVSRLRFFDKCNYGFQPTDLKLGDIDLPEEIVKRLQTMSKKRLGGI